MSRALPVGTDVEDFPLGGVATHFTALKSGVLSRLSFRSSVLLSAAEWLCDIASESDCACVLK